MSQTVKDLVSPRDAALLTKSKEQSDREGGEKPQANWKGFVAGVFSGVAKLSGTRSTVLRIFAL
jgi:hypothetical protein